ncbi:EpsG family protein [Enterovibrio sp. Hal110]
MSIRRNDLGLISVHMFLIIIYPLLSLVYALFLFITRRHVYAGYLLALSLAIFSTIYIPNSSADLSRWFLIYEDIANGGYSALVSWLKTRPDSLAYIFIYFSSNLGFSKEILSFVVILLSYSIYINIFYREVNNKVINYTHYALFGLVFLFALDHRVILLGVRQGLAIVVCIFALHYYINERINKAFMLFAIAMAIHFMSFAIIVIFLISKYIGKKSQNYIVVVSLLLMALPIDNHLKSLVNTALPFMSSESSAILETYTVGYWGQGYANDLSEKGRIQALITMIPLMAAYVYLLLFKNDSYYRNALSLSLLLVSAVSFSDTLLLRYSVVPTLLLPICFISEIKTKINNKLMLVFPVYCLLFIAMIYSSRHSILLTGESFLIMNVYEIINFNVEPY